MLLLQGCNYLCMSLAFWMQSTRVWAVRFSAGAFCSAFLWERDTRGVGFWVVGSWSSCFSILGELMLAPRVCHCYKDPIATQPPFTEPVLVLSLIKVWEIFLSCGIKAYLWYAGESGHCISEFLLWEEWCCPILSSPYCCLENHVHQRWKCQASPGKVRLPVPVVGFSKGK